MLIKLTKKLFLKTNSVLICKVCYLRGGVQAGYTPDELLKPILPKCNPETKILKVAVIGMPNAGKSTFVNQLLDRKVCATSSKVHTTKKKSLAIFTEDDAQIVFLDTPGIVSEQEQKKFNLSKSFLKDGKGSLIEADIVGVIHDVTNIWTRSRLDIKIIKMLESNKKPSFLVMNKVDLLKSKRKLLDLTRSLTGNHLSGRSASKVKGQQIDGETETKCWHHFGEIFMVSSLTGIGIEEVRNYLIKSAKPGKWMFPPQVWTNETAEDIIVNSVRGKLLDFLPQEIPYRLQAHIEYFNIDENNKIQTVVLVKCPTERIAKLIAGASDGKLRQITESVQNDLQDTFYSPVKINIILCK